MEGLKILYVHGFNGSPDGRTGTAIKEYFKNDVVVAPSFDLLNYEKTLTDIKNLIKINEIDVVVGQSFGGFYAVALGSDVFKIAINPCLIPSSEIQSLSEEPLSPGWVENMRGVENGILVNSSPLVRKNTFGIFGDNDELFCFSGLFNECFGTTSGNVKNMITVSGKHSIPSSQLFLGLDEAMRYFDLAKSKKTVKPKTKTKGKGHPLPDKVRETEVEIIYGIHFILKIAFQWSRDFSNGEVFDGLVKMVSEVIFDSKRREGVSKEECRRIIDEQTAPEEFVRTFVYVLKYLIPGKADVEKAEENEDVYRVFVRDYLYWMLDKDEEGPVPVGEIKEKLTEMCNERFPWTLT